MCGIAGIISLGERPVLEQEVREMCAAVHHRGPDQDGFHFSPGVGLGMRRLSIIDLSSGRQPIYNEDGSVAIVFNGEIYNYQELRRQLQRAGHVFSTRTDTEVIVHLYEEFGAHCVNYLRGMFAFAIWDENKKQLLLARDRLGIKPLYYAEVGGRLLFGSELKALLQLEEVSREWNWEALAHLFSFLTTPPAHAVLRGVRKLEPGHVLVAGPGRCTRLERYWRLEWAPDSSKTEQRFIGDLRELLEESVRLHMVSDVPIGAFLSGGIDSSAVVATAAKLSTGPLNTFSIGFSEPEYSELEAARAIASQVGANHRELVLGPENVPSFEDLAWFLDEPFGDSSAIPTYMVSQLAAQHVKVVLSGDGGDELFAGYDKYLVEKRERSRPALPGSVRRVFRALGETIPPGMRGRNFLLHRSMTGSRRYLDASTLFRADEIRRMFQPDFAEHLTVHEPWRAKAALLDRGRGDWLSRLQVLDIRSYLPLDILTKVDRMSMAHSIETRVPLLDHKLVEFAATIPAEMNLRGGTTKYILKRALQGILPQTTLQRPKRGFAVPLNRWFRGGLNTYIRDVVLGERAMQRGYFNRHHIEALVRRHERGENLDLQLWTLISFELWSRIFLDRAMPRPQRAAA